MKPITTQSWTTVLVTDDAGVNNSYYILEPL